MGKRGKAGQGDSRNPKRRAASYSNGDADDMMDDEIDAFHKQRDIVPLDLNDDPEASDDDEYPVLDLKNDEDSDDDEDEDGENDTHLAKKIKRQQKFLRGRIGGVEDGMDDDAEDSRANEASWGRRKDAYYTGPNIESDDDEGLHEEEAEVLRLQKEKAEKLAPEDFVLEDVSENENEGEPTMEEILLKGRASENVSPDRVAEDDAGTTYEEVKKDLSSLSKEELMDVVYSSAPELVGLLSELSDALNELENKVDPLLSKLKGVGSTKTGNLHYMEVKRLLLLAYCQAISFYLLLKSEGEPIRDHPVIARLVEIKTLLDKMKQLDANIPAEIEDILCNNHQTEPTVKLAEESTALMPDSSTNDSKVPILTEVVSVLPRVAAPAARVKSSKDDESKGRKHNHTNDQVGIQSMEMFKVRAALEEKLKQKGVSGPISTKGDKVQKRHQPVNGKLETFDDFGDEANATSQGGNKLSKLVVSRMNKPKVISGDDDLPERDDIGERRRKHELRVLGRVGIKSGGDDFGEERKNSENGGHSDAEMSGDPESGSESEDDVYKQVKQLRDAKLAAKEQMYSRTPLEPSLPEETAEDGKRHISYQMEKNRGLTRSRKKLTKNPRKKYKLKHEKAVVRRKGQVRDIRKPSGPYGGEESGINKNISKSIRF